jgi:hypothetical protein
MNRRSWLKTAALALFATTMPKVDDVAFWVFAHGDDRCVQWWMKDKERTKWWLEMARRVVVARKIQTVGIRVSSEEFPEVTDREELSRLVHLTLWMRIARSVFDD